jgi:hypothetical protein
VQGGAACPDELFQTRPCNEDSCPDPLCASCFQGSCYKLLEGQFTFSQAVSECSAICPNTNCLTSVGTDAERAYLVNSVSNGQPVWIDSWRQQRFEDRCLSMSTYGAIIIAQDGCNGTQLSAICEIPAPESCTGSQGGEFI